jgi:hypothetical protein
LNAAWFGLLMIALGAVNLWLGLQAGGTFPSVWPMPRIDRDHPILFGGAVLGNAGLIAIGAILLGRVPT